MRSRSFIELSSCAKICSRICFCLSSPFTISSNEASGFAFSSCEIRAPVCASIASVASQQGQMIVYLELSAIKNLLVGSSIATKRHKRHKQKEAGEQQLTVLLLLFPVLSVCAFCAFLWLLFTVQFS